MNVLCRLGLHSYYCDDVTIPSFRSPGKTETVAAELCRRCSYVDHLTRPCVGLFPGELLEDMAPTSRLFLNATQPDTSTKEAPRG